MPRLPLISFLLLAMGGCAAGSPGPGTLPADAGSAIYTTTDVQTVASCIARAIGSTAESVGDRLVIQSSRSPGISYSVGPNNRSGVYQTQIAIVGTGNSTADTKDVDRCSVSEAKAGL
jgi:hypothetical protein